MPVDQNLLTLTSAYANIRKGYRDIGGLELRYSAWTDRGWAQENLALGDLAKGRASAQLTATLHRLAPEREVVEFAHPQVGTVYEKWAGGEDGSWFFTATFQLPPPRDGAGFDQLSREIVPLIIINALVQPGLAVNIATGDWRPQIFLHDAGPLDVGF